MALSENRMGKCSVVDCNLFLELPISDTRRFAILKLWRSSRFISAAGLPQTTAHCSRPSWPLVVSLCPDRRQTREAPGAGTKDREWIEKAGFWRSLYTVMRLLSVAAHG